jgi:threonine dehydratase
MPTHSLSLANIEEAAQSIDPVFLHSPQYEDVTLNATLKRRVLVKAETEDRVRLRWELRTSHGVRGPRARDSR